ncbi:MAG: galactokinase [Chitinophagaceae bacterium]|nr:galactokinase [Chitinophagaceae bacterium]
MITIDQDFQQVFSRKPLVVAAPGRVNLIGEHTDYNEGFVLPGAVNKQNYVAVAENGTNTINLRGNRFSGSFSFSLDGIKPVKEWANYILGVIFHMQQRGLEVKGVDMMVDGDVPVGAGMSSSAALCCATGFALNELFGFGLTKMDLAYIGQKTEHVFVGLKSGIMDQFASLHGKAGHVIKLDCQSMEYEYIPFDFPDYKIVLVNSMVTHSLASSEYNVRRLQCEEGVSVLKKYYPEINTLRGIDSKKLLAHREELSEVVYNRCHFVTTENERLLQGCELLKKGDIKGFGVLMYQTHTGLSKEYEVSCKELDFLNGEARKYEAVAGSRMMGGGFGGCTINLVEASGVDHFTEGIKSAYHKEYHKEPEVYVTQIEDGARIIS